MTTFFIGVKGVIVNPITNKALVLLRAKPERTYWDIPGGRIDNEEKIIEALARELHEEIPSIGNFTIGKLLSAYRLSHDIDEDKGLVLLFYKVEAQLIEVKLSFEHNDYCWVGIEDLDSLNGKDGADIEIGYLEAIKLALEK